MKKKPRSIVVFGSLFFIMLLIVAGIVLNSVRGNDKKMHIDFKEKDYYSFQTIGEYIFKELDTSKYKVGSEYQIDPSVYTGDEAINLEDENISSKLQKYDVTSVYIIDKDSIMFNCGAYFQSTGGVIITRNGVVPKTHYENRGFDGDVIDLGKIDDGIYSYQAGL